MASEKWVIAKNISAILGVIKHYVGAQWLSGRVFDLRLKVCGFEPHCVVVLEQDTFILA